MLLALVMAQNYSSKYFLFLSDSLSFLHGMRNRDIIHPLPLFAKMLCCVHKILLSGVILFFTLVPSHVGLADYLAADSSPTQAN